MGDGADEFECESVEQLDACRVALYQAAADPARQEFECQKASQDVVDVNTDLGVQQLKVPRTFKAVKESPESEAWLEAERTALYDSILAYPGNRLVPRAVPLAAGVPIARTVTDRHIKLIEGGKLAKTWAKVRHAYDGGDGERKYAAAGISTDYALPAAESCDDLTLKLLLADASARDRNLTKGDVSNAYPKGKRLRPKSYMELPASFRGAHSVHDRTYCCSSE